MTNQKSPRRRGEEDHLSDNKDDVSQSGGQAGVA